MNTYEVKVLIQDVGIKTLVIETNDIEAYMKSYMRTKNVTNYEILSETPGKSNNLLFG